MEFYDTAPLSSVRRTADGYLVADVRVARTGIQTYRGSELGLPHLEMLRVYRPEEAVFDAASLRTYAHRPVTRGHPDKNVSSKNWRDLSVGILGGEVVRDGQYVRVPLMLMDEDVISLVESGAEREVSMGYTASLELSDGVTPEGEPYDAVMSGLRMNHVAVCRQARGGSELRIGDNTKEQAMPDNLKKVVVDGLTIEVTDQGHEAIGKLQRKIEDAAAEHQRNLDAKDAQLATKDAEIDELKKKIVTDEQLQEMVAKRQVLVDAAIRITGDNNIAVGKVTDAEIRRAVVAKKLGDQRADATKSDAYIEVAFDTLADAANKADPVKDSVSTASAAATSNLPSNFQAYQQMIADMANAHLPAAMRSKN